MMRDGGSLLTLSYFGAERVVPHYNVMGRRQGGLSRPACATWPTTSAAATSGVNALSAGPMKTLAASGIGDFRYILKWNQLNAPLRRNVSLDEVGGAALYLLSDLSAAVTGEIPPRRLRLSHGGHAGGRRGAGGGRDAAGLQAAGLGACIIIWHRFQPTPPQLFVVSRGPGPHPPPGHARLLSFSGAGPLPPPGHPHRTNRMGGRVGEWAGAAGECTMARVGPGRGCGPGPQYDADSWRLGGRPAPEPRKTDKPLIWPATVSAKYSGSLPGARATGRPSVAWSTARRRGSGSAKPTSSTGWTAGRPGQSRFTTQRREPDRVRILSGVFEGATTGAPISLMIDNVDARERDYDDIKDRFRPGHADYTYWKKYGIRDYRGGGRASARETAMRVAAGAVGRKVLDHLLDRPVAIRGAPRAGRRARRGPRALGLGAGGAETRSGAPTRPRPRPGRACSTACARPALRWGAVIEVVASGLPPAGLGEPVYGKLDFRPGPGADVDQCGEGRRDRRRISPRRP